MNIDTRLYHVLAAVITAAGCNPLMGIEQVRCEPGCVDEATRLVCTGETARAEPCPESSETCATPACNAGQCGFQPAVGKVCGRDGLATCNEGYACVGPAVRMSAILRNTCIVADDTKVWCWGANEYGQLGDWSQNDAGSPVLVRGLPDQAIAISVGYSHACALLTDGHVRCWGDNSYGQCGTGRPGSPLLVPTLVDTSDVTFSAISSGGGHTCALAIDQTVYCWGDNQGGQCGVDPAVAGVTTVGPTRIPHFDTSSTTPRYLDRVLKVETVKAHTCALRSEEPKVVCWGSNTYYEKMIISHALGPKAAGMPYSARPVPVELEGDAIDIGMGFESSYAVTQDGRVFAWGYNGRAQLGVNNLETVVPVPSLVFSDVGPEPQPLLGATEVLRTDGSHQCARVGSDFSAASSADPSPYVCWGSNDWGELGFGASALGHTTFRFALPARTLPKAAKTLVMGEDHACFSATQNGETKLFCYGNGASVGNGATGADAPVQWQAQPVVWDPVNFASRLEDTAE